MFAIWGLRVENPNCWPLFSSFFDNSWAKHFWDISLEALQSLQSRPCARPAHVAESGPLARLQVLQNSGSQMFILRVKTFPERDCHWRNQRKKNYREHSNIKSTCVSALIGSVLAKWPRGCREFKHHARIKPEPSYSLWFTLTTKPWVCVNLQEKMVY